VISIGKPQDSGYYLNEPTGPTPLGYYVNEHRSGVASGTLAQTLGLEGPLERVEAEALLTGRNPNTGDRLTTTAVQRPFFDVTASPPKSVSVFEAAATGDQRTATLAALSTANSAMLEFLEAEACGVRRGRGGIDHHPGSGLAVVTFTHTTSRADDADPQFHNHNLIVNASTGPDGRTTGLDTRQLYANRYAADAVYQAVLRHELATNLGVLFTEPDRHGTSEIVGIDKDIRDEFSQRRKAIAADMAERGTATSRAALMSTLATRTPKGEELEAWDQRARWAQRFDELGFTLDQIPTVERQPAYHPDHEQLALAVTEQTSTFERRHVIAAAAHAALDGATLDQIMATANNFLASEHAVALDDRTWTTPEILELEQRSVAIALEGIGARINEHDLSRRIDARLAGEAIAARPSLSEEQAAMVRSVLTDGNTVNMVIGAPGSGKTFALDAIRDGLPYGDSIRGAALSATAARNLQNSSGISSTTIHRLLQEPPRDSDPRTVTVIDEAAMVGTRQLAELIARAHNNGSKLVLVGDPHQLPELDAGGLFAALAQRLPVSHLDENRRQTNPTERAILTNIRTNQIDHAAFLLDHNGAIVSNNADALRARVVADWGERFCNGDDALMLVSTRHEALALNERAQHLLQRQGRLGPALAQTPDAIFHQGDHVIGLRNDHRHDLLNGTRAIVESATQRGDLRLRLADGTHRIATADYIADGHLGHGYALTVHKAQGITVDSSFLLANDATYKELAYTGLSRGRNENLLYSVVDQPQWESAQTLNHLRRTLETERAKTAAIDHKPHLGIER
jgi:conjugative relaxase-like TrwC/TraI family protein